jgi:hypothetical protein
MTVEVLHRSLIGLNADGQLTVGMIVVIFRIFGTNGGSFKQGFTVT